MEVKVKPECPKYFTLSKKDCHCKLNKRYIGKHKKSKKHKKKVGKKTQKLIKYKEDVAKRPKCPRGMRFNPVYNECEIASKRLPDELKVKKIKTQKKKTKKKAKTLKRKAITIKDLVESGILGSDSSSGKDSDTSDSTDSDEVIITQNLYPKSINKSVLNQNLKKKTQNFSTQLENLMNEYSKHKTAAKKQVKFQTNPLIQDGGYTELETPTPTALKMNVMNSPDTLPPTPTPTIMLKPLTPMYEVTLRETIMKDQSLKEKPIGKRELTKIIAQTERSMKETLAKKSNIADLKKGTSFSPALNKLLLDVKSDNSLLLEDCDTLQTAKIPKIRIDVNGRKQCVPYTDPIAQNHMLKILGDKKDIDCSQIIAPRQILSNCWFNAMFMTYFVSDKGRKFNRFFRQLMIVGKTLNGEVIPANLHKILFKLNMSIEACLNSNMKKDTSLNKIADTLNTNIYIKQIHRLIKKDEIRGVNMSGNPMKYYESLVSYLGSERPLHMKVTIGSSLSENNQHDWYSLVKKEQEKLHGIPDVIVLELFFDKSNYSIDRSFRRIKRTIDFDLNIKNERGETEKVKYALDSAIVRNTEQHHFAAAITCNKKEFVFDGLSFSRLIPFKWKNKLNSNTNWSFDYKDDKKLFFNFTDGYQLLFYYRV